MDPTDTLNIALPKSAPGLTGNFVQDYAAAIFTLLLVLTAMTFTHFKRASTPAPFARMMLRATNGVPSLLAIGLTSTIITLAITRTPIPQFLEQAFLVVIGYYFGQAGKQSPAEADSKVGGVREGEPRPDHT
jgi:hypothetical protein